MAAEEFDDDRLDVDGTPGPGPGSVPAEPGQYVAHWVRRYATVEIRWPASVAAQDLTPIKAIAGFPAAIDEGALETGARRVATILTISNESTNTGCDRLEAVVYADRSDPLGDYAYLLSETLRPRSELDEYLAAQQAQITQAEPTGRPAGRCVEALLAGTSDSEDAGVRELIGRFVADRLAAKAAESCLTEAALLSYLAPQQGEHRLCLYQCTDGSSPMALVGEIDVSSSGATYVLEFSNGERVRETLEIVPVANRDNLQGERLLIVAASPDVESWVSEEMAVAFVSEFFEVLAADDFEQVDRFYYNEGISESVMNELAVFDYQPLGGPLSEYCKEALCDVRYKIIGSDTSSPMNREVIVELVGPSGPVEWRVSVGMFEGQLTLDSLPPRG